MRWSVGEKVMAKWPGSALYYHGEIISIDKADETAEVLYSDGTKMEIPMSYIKSENAFHPPKQSKSPSRSRRRSKSPARKSPSRKSPARSPSRRGRAPKTDDENRKRQQSRSSSRGRGRNQVSKTSSSATDRKVLIKATQDTVTTTISEKVTSVTLTKHDVSETAGADSRYMVTRQRAKAMITTHAATIDTSKYFQKTESSKRRHGDVLGAFIGYITSPLLPLVVLLACSKANCSITKLRRSMIPDTWEAYFSLKAFAIVFGFALFHAIIYALPFGYIIKGPATPKGNRLDYRISARYTLFFTATAYGAMYYKKVPLLSIHDELLHLAVAAFVISVVANFLFYIKSFWCDQADLNPVANTGSFLYDSFMGRELHPRLGKLFDVKLYLFRVCMASWLVMVWIEMSREYELHGRQHTTEFLLVAISQVIYVIMSFFYDEEQCPYMFEVKNEGLGFPQWYGEMVVVPFVYTLHVIYLVDHQPNLHLFSLIAVALLEGIGLFLIVWSARQKIIFRMNPYDWRVAGFESLPPSREEGDRLLVSGLWGVVRHPNYLGEILVAFGWSLACGFQQILTWFYPIFITFYLCHRAVRVEVASRARHGLAWSSYCNKVKYRVIPNIF